MRTTNNKTARELLPAIIAAMAVVTAAFALNVAVRLAHTSPHVGDIVAFQPLEILPLDDSTRLLVHRQNQFGCVLDLNVLRHDGGSLIIETQPGVGVDSFRVHWAGTRTSEDAGDCGSDADLIVSRLDLDVLSLSAGGYGVGPKRMMPLFTSDIGAAN